MANDTIPLAVIEKTFKIIDYLEANDGGRVTQIAADLDLPPSTVHSHLDTFNELGVIVQEDQTYYLSLKFLRYGRYAEQRKEVYQVAETYVDEIQREIGYRAVFLVEEHGRGVFLHRNFGERASWKHAKEGETGYLHTLAAGKALLASLPEQERTTILDRHGLPQLTSNTITDRNTLESELVEIRDQGFAINAEESRGGIHAVGVPATQSDGSVFGAFSVSAPANRLSESEMRNEIAEELIGIVNEFELELELT